MTRRLTIAALAAACLATTSVAVTIGTQRGFSADAGAPNPSSEQEARKEMTMADAAVPDLCADEIFEDQRFLVCRIEPGEASIRIMHGDAAGKPFGTLAKALSALDAEADTQPLFVTNGGMYHRNLGPVGLMVIDGEEKRGLSTRIGFGNFFLKPNGVFAIDRNGRAHVMDTDTWREAAIAPLQATQSGPMLVIDGALHPRFIDGGTSKNTRSGIGVTEDGTVVIAITRDPINFHSFGRYFRDVAKTPNALFLDGSIIGLIGPDAPAIATDEPAGPIIAVTRASAHP